MSCCSFALALILVVLINIIYDRNSQGSPASAAVRTRAQMLGVFLPFPCPDMLEVFLPFPCPDVVVRIVHGRRLLPRLLLHLEVHPSSRKPEILSELALLLDCDCEQSGAEKSVSEQDCTIFFPFPHSGLRRNQIRFARSDRGFVVLLHTVICF